MAEQIMSITQRKNMDTPKNYDEQTYGDRVRDSNEEENKSHDSGEKEPDHKTCQWAKINKDEIYCCYKNNELHFCGVPCPIFEKEE